ncbi:hypothetical protein BH18ACT6_BH18ACT6_19460 [soil metagenome]
MTSHPRARKEDWALVSTLVEKGASIGANATIVCGVRIGRLAFVAAGAVVTKDVQPQELVAGNPARRVGWVCRCGATILRGSGDLVETVTQPVDQITQFEPRAPVRKRLGIVEGIVRRAIATASIATTTGR